MIQDEGLAQYVMKQKASEVYEEWIEESSDQDCIQMCELFALTNYLNLPYLAFTEIEKLLPEMSPDIARWYGMKWNKPLPFEVNYGSEVIADMEYDRHLRNNDYIPDPFLKYITNSPGTKMYDGEKQDV